jgi:uncharacterized protein (TIGR03546 family)
VILRTIGKLVALLNSNSRPGEIGAGIAYGLLLALVPANNLLFVLLAVLLFFIKVNLGLAIVFSLIFSLLTPIVDPLVNQIGVWLLTNPSLESAFATAYSIDPLPWTRFNDGLVLGGFVVGIALFVPVLLSATLLVRLYRKHIHDRIANSRLVKAITRVPIVQKIVSAANKARAIWSRA